VRDRWPNEITAANAGKHLGFAGKSRVGLILAPAWLSSGVSPHRTLP